MTPIHHLRMSHHSDAHESCTLMLPVSKHDSHLSPMERGRWWVIIFWGRGTRVMTPIHHLRMSHHSDAHESCTLMLPVSKHDAHLSPMERGQWWVIIFWGRGDPRHDAHLSSEDESSSSCSWIMYIDAPSVKTWCSFITHGEGAMVSHHFLGGPQTWRSFITLEWVIILMTLNLKYGANIQRHSIIFWTSHSNVCILKK